MRHEYRGKAMVTAAVAVMLIAAGSLACAAESYPFDTITNDQVNLRKNASSTSVILDSVSKGDSLTVLGEKGNYYKVRYGSRTGYVIKKYVAVEAAVTPAPTQAPTATGYPYETTAAESVNLRAKTSVYSQKLATIKAGDMVTVEKITGSFAKVTYKGKSGYCKHEFLNLKQIVKATPTPTAIPTLSPDENASSYQMLQKGATGSHVRALQEALIELGFLSGKADGTFGAGTQNAVIAFQRKNDYPDTGIVDANLQAFLYSGKPKNAKGTKTEIKTLPPVAGVNIRLNDRGELVEKVQTFLITYEYYDGKVSGVYDSATRNAVKSFQKKNGLKADGVCGQATQELLFSGNGLLASATATPVPTNSPTPAPTFQVPGETVAKGSTGDDAKLVQKRLKELGYLTGKADGKFGTLSVNALKAFQLKHDLKADGMAGPSTYAVLFSYNAMKANEQPTPAPTIAPTPAPAEAETTYAPITKDNVVTIRKGTTGDAVIHLQSRLTELGYYNAYVDGKCKDDDVAAIKVFQKNNGLTVDGVAGYATQVKLFSVTAITDSGNVAAGTVDKFTTLRKGDISSAVQSMQERLITLGYLDGEADGNFGRATFQAVYAFQKASGLVRDGVAGTATLTKLYATDATQAKPTATPAPAVTTLRRGDANQAVKEMQARLIQMGYLSGDADGSFGVQTYRALMAFQKANGLYADGIAGKQTLAMLQNANAVGAGGVTLPSVNNSPTTGNLAAQVKASNVQYLNWYKGLRAHAKKYPYVTVYDFQTGISWQMHMFSFGAHADAEPLTAADTAKMEKAFGGNYYDPPKPVWVIFADGSIYMASTHSMPHSPQHITDNEFDGHTCIHFPRTASQVASIGPYATKHQKTIDAGWAKTQDMIN